MTNTDWLQLCDDIDDGAFDEGLSDISKAVASRRDIVNRRNARRLQRAVSIGDKVVLTNRITPRYLEGCTGTIKEIRSEAAVVILDSLPTHRGRPPAEGHKNKFLIPFVHLVKADEDVQSLKNHDVADEIGDDEEYEDEEEVDEDD